MGVFVHPSAEVSGKARVGDGTMVWHQAQVRENARIGRNCRLGKGAYVDRNVVLGDDCKLQNNATLYDGVTCGNGVFIGPHAVFTNDLYPRAVSPDWKVVPTRVEDGVSVGANATIVCGVRLGRFAMIAAGAVVTRDVPAHALVVGVPGRVVGYVCEKGHRLDARGRCAPCKRTFAVRRPRRQG
jgi:acetyltransferase-like isoleucine patch superfamily enzyme